MDWILFRRSEIPFFVGRLIEQYLLKFLSSVLDIQCEYMKILLTGPTGSVGIQALQELHKEYEEHEIIVLEKRS